MEITVKVSKESEGVKWFVGKTTEGRQAFLDDSFLSLVSVSKDVDFKEIRKECEKESKERSIKLEDEIKRQQYEIESMKILLREASMRENSVREHWEKRADSMIQNERRVVEEKEKVLEKMIESFSKSSKSPQEKGKEGEEWLMSYLSRTFQGSKLTPTPFEKGGGDIRMNLNGTLYFIESKNKEKYIGTELVREFEKKVIQEFEMYEEGVAIFVAQRATGIAKKRNLCVDVVNTKAGRLAIVYVCDVYSYPDLISAAIYLGKRFVESSYNGNDQLQGILVECQNILMKVKESLKMCKSDKKLLNSLIHNNKERNDLIKAEINTLVKILSSQNDTKIDSDLYKKLFDAYEIATKSDSTRKFEVYEEECNKKKITTAFLKKNNLKYNQIGNIYQPPNPEKNSS